MSSKALAWVIEHSQTRGNARLVMLALADAADDNGVSVLTGYDSPHIQRWANLSPEEAEAATAEAVESGELQRGLPEGRNWHQSTILTLAKITGTE